MKKSKGGFLKIKILEYRKSPFLPLAITDFQHPDKAEGSNTIS